MSRDPITDSLLIGAYRDFLAENEPSGGSIVIGEVTFSAPDQLYDDNEVTSAQKQLPGFIQVGQEGGGLTLLLRLEIADDGPVFLADLTDPASIQQIAPSFAEWVGKGCPLPLDDDGEVDWQETVALFLDRVPAKLETLSRIRKKLLPAMGLMALRELARKAPVELAQLSRIAAHRVCTEVDKVERCLSIRSPNEPARP